MPSREACPVSSDAWAVAESPDGLGASPVFSLNCPLSSDVSPANGESAGD